MKLEADKVSKILMDCLYREEEVGEVEDGKAPEGAVVIEGIMQKFGFNPERLEVHKAEIRELLAELPDEFMADKGGGMSFMQACVDRNGDQWGEQPTMDELFVLGQAAGMVKLLMPREMWGALPGGMPYFVVDVRE